MEEWNKVLMACGLSASCPLGDEHRLFVSGDGDHLACRKCHRTYKMQDGEIIPTYVRHPEGDELEWAMAVAKKVEDDNG